MSQSGSPSDSAVSARKWRLPSWRWLCLLLIPIILIVIGAALDYQDDAALQKNLLLLDDMSEVFQGTADAIANHPDRTVWIVDRKPQRIVRLGAIASIPETHLKDLQLRGVARDRCRVVQTDASTEHEMIRQFLANPQTKGQNFTVTVGSARGRFWRYVIDQAVSPDDAARFKIATFATPWARPTRWFLNRAGGKKVQEHWLELLFVIFMGESQCDPTDPYADVFEGELIGT